MRDRLRRELKGEASRGRFETPLNGSFAVLQESLSSYGALHYAESVTSLAKLKSAGRSRNLLLVGILGFGLLSAIAIVVVARGIVRRVRDCAFFAGHVAEGDLAARLTPRGSDELTTLAGSLNGMVGQLSAASSHRETSEVAEHAYRARQDAFSQVLQVTEHEAEAHKLLKLHLERGVAASRVVVLNTNNSRDRLEAATPLPPGSPLEEILQSAEPRSCLAVRVGQIHESGGNVASLLECEVCGITPEQSTCVPLLVSGEVIGSVVVDHAEKLSATHSRCVNESVAQAAPILGNLRNLALAEARAAMDTLTGLPNRRAVNDSLKRMLAQSSRAASPLAVILLDLDHFKQINDTFGHEEGDAVLAAVGDVLSSAMRSSDFVGRNGGEEFIALLPDTDADGAAMMAERLLVAIAKVKPARMERTITASLGVAVHPDVATDSETLLRLADRALYAAKRGGRNRVETAETGTARTTGDAFKSEGDPPVAHDLLLDAAAHP